MASNKSKPMTGSSDLDLGSTEEFFIAACERAMLTTHASAATRDAYFKLTTILKNALNGSAELRAEAEAIIERSYSEYCEANQTNKRPDRGDPASRIAASNIDLRPFLQRAVDWSFSTGDIVDARTEDFFPSAGTEGIQDEFRNRSTDFLNPITSEIESANRQEPPRRRTADKTQMDIRFALSTQAHAEHLARLEESIREREVEETRVALVKTEAEIADIRTDKVIARLDNLRFFAAVVSMFEWAQREEPEVTERELRYMQPHWERFSNTMDTVGSIVARLEDPEASQIQRDEAILDSVVWRTYFLHDLINLETAKVESFLFGDWRFVFQEERAAADISKFHQLIDWTNFSIPALNAAEETELFRLKVGATPGFFERDKFVLPGEVWDLDEETLTFAAQVRFVVKNMKQHRRKNNSSEKETPRASAVGLPNPNARKRFRTLDEPKESGSETSAHQTLQKLVCEMSSMAQALRSDRVSPPADPPVRVCANDACGLAHPGFTYFCHLVPATLPVNIKLALGDLEFINQELWRIKRAVMISRLRIRRILSMGLLKSERDWLKTKEGVKSHLMTVEYEHKRGSVLSMMHCWRTTESKIFKYAARADSKLAKELDQLLDFLRFDSVQAIERVWQQQYDLFKSLATPVDEIITVFDKLRVKEHDSLPRSTRTALHRYENGWEELENACAPSFDEIRTTFHFCRSSDEAKSRL